ncbi:hypothetical protein LZ31DRAFT_247125 [Colletotrichum somersetense]|nr:hypothetical protein LZ31DRAFT_247125 [Colletotrichum somersetense]
MADYLGERRTVVNQPPDVRQPGKPLSSGEPDVCSSLPGQYVPFDGKGDSFNVRSVDGDPGVAMLARSSAQSLAVGLAWHLNFPPFPFPLPFSPPRLNKRARSMRNLTRDLFSPAARTLSNISFADYLTHTRAEASRQVQVYLVSPLAAPGVSSPPVPSLSHTHTHYPLAPPSTRCRYPLRIRQYHAGAKGESASGTG